MRITSRPIQTFDFKTNYVDVREKCEELYIENKFLEEQLIASQQNYDALVRGSAVEKATLEAIITQNREMQQSIISEMKAQVDFLTERLHRYSGIMNRLIAATDDPIATQLNIIVELTKEQE